MKFRVEKTFAKFQNRRELVVIHEDNIKLILLNLVGHSFVAATFHNMNLENSGLHKLLEMLGPSAHCTLWSNDQSAARRAILGTVGTDSCKCLNSLTVFEGQERVRSVCLVNKI